VTVVIDAGPLVAFTDLRDPRYAAVRRIMLAEPGPLVIPAPVTAEADYLIASRIGENARRDYFDDLAVGRFDVECLLPEDYARIATLQRQYADLRPGLADLSVVVIAARRRCTRVLSFDERHFRAIRPLYGDAFTLLPADA
jgi:predicted nucleic acid-binding protein